MRRHLLTIAVVATFLSAAVPTFAQSKTQLGAGLAYGGGIEELALDVRVGFAPFGNVRNVTMAINFDYFFSTISFWTVDGNVHWELLNFSRGGGAYLLGGLEISHYVNTGLGLNLGGGVHGPIGPVDAFAELKAVIIDNSQVVLTGGFNFDI